jgi:hypothetical protein
LDTAWIPIDVREGMFSTEYAVCLKLSNGNIVSLFADKFLVMERGGIHYLKVTLISKETDQVRVRLPSETFETGSPWVDVSNESIVL